MRLVCLFHFFWLCSIWVLSKISRVFGGGHTEAQTKSPGRVSSNDTSAEGSAPATANSKDCSSARDLGFCSSEVPLDGMWTGPGGDHRKATGDHRRQGRNRHTGSWEGWKMREEEVVTGAGLIIQREGVKR